MTMITGIYVGLGSNIGDRQANLREAIERMASLGVRLVRTSSIYETEPVGYVDQPWFLNQVIEVQIDSTIDFDRVGKSAYPDESGDSSGNPIGADGSPADSVLALAAERLLRVLLKVESSMGRERSVPNGPRVIDIDLLLFADLITGYGCGPDEEEGRLPTIVPHPRMHLRRFVIKPLCEIAPDANHPILRKNYQELLEGMADDSVVRRWA